MSAMAGAIGSRAALYFLVQASLLGAITPEASQSAARKLQRVAEGAVASGESLVFLQDEINAYVRFEAAARIPQGVEDPELEFRDGGSLIRARIDLAKAGSSVQELPPLMRLLLRGTRTVTVDVDYQATDGYAVAKLVSMRIEELELSGAVLEWFLDAFSPPELRPYLLGQKVKLQGGVREVRLEPGRAVIVAD